MSIARFNRLENIDGDVDIDVRDIQITYDALVLKGEYRPDIILKKYQDAFYKDGEIYVAAREVLPIALTGNWEVDREKVRIYATMDHTASFANERANSAEESAQNAQESEEKADLWANAPHGVEIEPGKYSARHYAEDAELITGTKDFVRRSRNLSDVNIVAARQNLGIGSAASATLLQGLGDSLHDVVSQRTVTEHLNTKVDKLLGHSLYPDIDRAKLRDIEENATKNATDAQLRSRTTHTGQQPISSVTGLQAALDNKVYLGDERLTDAREWTASEVTRTEAETGTDTTAKKWTAQRVRQAILGWWNSSSVKIKLDGIAEEATKNATDDYLLSRSNHTGVQPISTVSELQTALDSKVDKVTGKGLSTEDFTEAEKTKLAGVTAGATKNAPDEALRDRATHTGEQEISSVTGLQAALDNKVESSSLSPVAISGSYSDLEDLPSIPEEFDLINWLTNASESEINQIKTLLGIE